MTAKEPVRLNTNFLVSKFGNYKYLTDCINEKALHLFKAILIHTKGKQANVVRTGVEFKNLLEETSMNVEACTASC